MKIKILMIIGFVLLITAFSSVNATEIDDLSVIQEISLNEEIENHSEVLSYEENSLKQKDNPEVSYLNSVKCENENLLSQSLEGNVSYNLANEITKDDFYVYTVHSLSTEDDDWDNFQILVADFPCDGTLNIFVDNNLKFSKNIIAKDNKFLSLNIDDVKHKLGINSPGKDYHISIKYKTVNGELELANYRFYLYEEDVMYIQEYLGVNDNGVLATIYNPNSNYLAGSVEVRIDGKKVFTKNLKSSDKLRFFDIKTDNIGKGYALGNHNVKVTYKSSNGKIFSNTRLVTFVSTVPDIYYFDTISVGEKQSIVIKSAKKTTGTVNIYNAIFKEFGEDTYKWVKGNKLSDFSIVNGHGNFPLDHLSKGMYNFILEYDVSGYKDTVHITINVLENSKGFTAKVTPTQITYGNNFIVKLKGPKSSHHVFIYVDNKYKADCNLKKGFISNKISGLGVGKHSIRVEIDYGKIHFSKTFNVLVKKSNIKLTLKKIKVRKSAKRLVLSSTLKIKGKIAKNKKVTFKFNKKTFKVNTNKNGVAKVIINKNLYKKLKIGKKITYQVIYGKLSVKKTVKVLR